VGQVADGQPQRGSRSVRVLAFFLLDWLIELPWGIYAQWWRERS
jgi:hypothetical protein